MLQLVLLIGKAVFLLVLYGFVLMVVRSATRDLKALQTWHAPAAYDLAPRPPVGMAPPAAPMALAGAGAAPLRVAPPPVLPGTRPNMTAEIWSLVAEGGPNVAQRSYEVPVGAYVVVGRAPDANIQLHDTFVSSHHARLEGGSHGLTVEDMNSTNGTFVNGIEIGRGTRATLIAGDTVAFGDTVFRVESH